MEKIAKITMMIVIITITGGCNSHNPPQGSPHAEEPAKTEAINLTVGSDGEIAVRTSEPKGIDDFGPPATAVDYKFKLTPPAVAVFVGTHEIDLVSTHNLQLWPVYDVSKLKQVMTACFGTQELFSEHGMKAALTVFACSEVGAPELAPLPCPTDCFMSGEAFGYLDWASTLYWPIDSGQEGAVFILRR